MKMSQLCPVKPALSFKKVSVDEAFQPILLGADLNLVSAFLGKFQGLRPWEACHERRQDAVCTNHGVRSLDQLWT
jgi:hypothetical protein